MDTAAGWHGGWMARRGWLLPTTAGLPPSIWQQKRVVSQRVLPLIRLRRSPVCIQMGCKQGSQPIHPPQPIHPNNRSLSIQNGAHPSKPQPSTEHRHAVGASAMSYELIAGRPLA